MKRFEFSLGRVLDLRRQQASVEQARLQALLGTVNQLIALKRSLITQLDGERTSLKESASTGEDLRVFVEYDRHIRARCNRIDRDVQLVQRQVQEQQIKTRNADRQVKLLENLKDKKLTEWTRLHDKELEELAADSYMARMSAEQRRMAAENFVQLQSVLPT